MNKNKIFILIGVALLALLFVSFDKDNDPADNTFSAEVSPSQIAPASVYLNDEALKAYIKRVTLQGYIPHFDEQINTELVSIAYKELYEESNADKKVHKNMWEGIRDGESKKGSIVEIVKYQE